MRTQERPIICESCGEPLGSEPVDAEGDYADKIVPADDCPFCNEGDA